MFCRTRIEENFDINIDDRKWNESNNCNEAMAPVSATRSGKKAPKAQHSNFENLLVECAKTLSPSKAQCMDISKIDVSRIKKALLDELQSQSQEPTTSGNSTPPINTPTNGPLTAKRGSSKFLDHFSARTQSLVRTASENNLNGRRGSTSNSSILGDFNDKRQQRDLKKRLELRQKRRKSRHTEEKIGFTGVTQDHFAEVLKRHYDRLLEEKSCSAQIYNILTRSMRDYCRMLTWTENVEILTMEMVERHLLCNGNKLGDKFKLLNPPAEHLIKEYELQILLQLFVVSDIKDKPVDEGAIGNVALLLRMIHFTDGSDRHTKFLEETVLDEFIDLPSSENGEIERRRHFAALFDEMNRPLPPELVNFGNADDNQSSVDISIYDYDPRSSPRKNSLTVDKIEEKPKKKLEPKLKAAKIKVENVAVIKDTFAPKKLKRSANASSAVVRRKSKLQVDKVPETPIRKMMAQSEKRKLRSLPSDLKPVVIETPEKSIKTLVLKLPRKIDAPARQSPREHASTRAICAMTKKKTKPKIKTEISNDLETTSLNDSQVLKLGKEYYLENLQSTRGKKTKKTTCTTPKDDFDCGRSSGCDSRSSFVRKNLADTFSDPESAGKQQKTPRKSSFRKQLSVTSTGDQTTPPESKPEGITLRLKRSRIVSPPPNEVPSKRMHLENEQFKQWLLPESAVESYKDHVQKIRTAKYRKLTKEGEVFYARGARRLNVFEAQEKPAFLTSGRTTRQSSANQAKTPKNRTGRKVRSAELHFVASYLLNVQNDKPTVPISPKVMAHKVNSPYKMSKLLRMPSKNRRRQLHKLRQKAEEEAVSNSTDRSDMTSVTSDPDSRGPSVRPLRIEIRPEPKTLDDLFENKRCIDRLFLSPRNSATTNRLLIGNGMRRRSASLSLDSSATDEIPRRSGRLNSVRGDEEDFDDKLEIKLETDIVVMTNSELGNGYFEEDDDSSKSPVFGSSPLKLLAAEV